MILNIRSQFTEIFKSTDSAGQPIFNDIVRATVQYSNSAYFDGYTYSAEPTTLMLKNLNDGNYELSLYFKKTGLHTIKIWSSANISLFKEITLEVVSDVETVKRKYLFDQLISFDLEGTSTDEAAILTIQNLDTSAYVTSMGQQSMVYSDIPMNIVGEGVFHYEMALGQGTYEIVMKSPSKTNSFTAIVSNVAGTELVDIDHTVVTDPSGEASVTVDSRFVPMSGVRVRAIDPLTMAVKGAALTDSSGNWSMSVPRGTYLFKFSKDGYNSTLFEGQVI